MSLKDTLDGFYMTFDFDSRLSNDPIEFPRQYKAKKDIEVVAFISALFAYGQVPVFKAFLKKIFSLMGRSPYAFIREFDEKRDSQRFIKFKYRFYTEEDIILLLLTLKATLAKHASLKTVFLEHYNQEDRTIKSALIGFLNSLKVEAGYMRRQKKGFNHFFPSPEKGSACKRLNLFLRWMVRDRDIDFGLWKEVPKDRLIIPLDTHIARIARCLSLTSRKSEDWKMAEEITESLRKLDPEDPLKYDFALCHQGISGLCKNDHSTCKDCLFMQ